MQVEQKLSIANNNKFKPKWTVLFHNSEKVCRKLSLKHLMFVVFLVGKYSGSPKNIILQGNHSDTK